MHGTKLLGCIAVALWAVGPPAAAQVVRDGSLGMGTIGAGIDSDMMMDPNNTMMADYLITEEHGEFSGRNLFHSFSEFSIGTKEIASFTLTDGYAGPSVHNIIAGVSGGSASNIDGTIKTTADLTGAALFLLNPAGVFFSDDAKLDVKGSFHASTADVMHFSDGDNFDVLDTSPARILSNAAPSAFGFTRPDASRLTVSHSDLEVPPGETLSLIGADDPSFPGLAGTEIFSDGSSQVIFAQDATVQIAAAGRPGIKIPVVLTDLDMDSLEPGDLGVVLVRDAGIVAGVQRVDMRAGSVVIRAGEFILSDGAKITAFNSVVSDELEPIQKDAIGPIDIAATGDITIKGGSQIRTDTSGAGAASDVLLHAGQKLSVTGASEDGRRRSSVLSFSTGSGAGGAIDIGADQISIDEGEIKSQSSQSGAGGAIDLEARGSYGIELTGGATVVSLAKGAGVGGDIDVRAQRLTISNQANAPLGTFIATNTVTEEDEVIQEGDGTGGRLRVEVGTLELLDGGQLFASTNGAANAGALTVNASTLVHLSGVSLGSVPSKISADANQDATGTGGQITIISPIVEVLNGAQITSDTIGAGEGGAVEIIASDRVTVEGGANGVSTVAANSFIRPGTEQGPSGTIRIETDHLQLLNGGQVTASTSGTGDAGSIMIEARNIAISGASDPTGFNPSGVFSQSNTFGVPDGGDGGDIAIAAFQDISISDGGIVSTKTDGPGLGGSIEITAGRSVRLDGGFVRADAIKDEIGSGNAGNIDIVAGQTFKAYDSAVTTEAEDSSGGNIEITASNLIYLESSQIETEVNAGNPGEAAGDVTAQSEVVALNHSSVVANAFGLDVDAGNISITADQFVLSGDSFLQASADLGINGTINVSSPDADLTGTLATLSESFLDASALLARDCAARTARAGSFAVDTRGEIPPPPDAMFEFEDIPADNPPADGAEKCSVVEDLS